MNYGRFIRALLDSLGWRQTPRFARPATMSRTYQPPVATPLERPVTPAVPSRPSAAVLRRLVLEVFNPAQPVEDRSQLLGRSAELNQLLGAMLDMRTHALVFGARGAGKTSLVRAFGDHADQRGHVVLYFSCDGSCTFSEIFAPYLDDLPDMCFAPNERADARAAIAALPTPFGARALASVLARVTQRDVIFVVDEFDRVTDPGTRAEIAALLKLLSDLRARVQLLFVGIARDMSELIDAHPSLRRHLMAVPLRRFDSADVSDLFDRGLRRTGLRFTPEAQEMIATLAAGSPYHLRLFCFCAAMAAIDRRATDVGREEVDIGLRFALDMWAPTNQRVAELFNRLAAQGPAMREELEELARQSLAGERLMPPELVSHTARHSGRDGSGATALALLMPALTPSDGETAYVFEDSLAPQLLLVSCHLAALSERGETPSSEPQAARYA
jgi:hypothetical protein